MRAEESRHTSRRNGVARARMYLKSHLHWLRGYPVNQSESCVGWVCLPAETSRTPTATHLDREHLRRAQFALNKLIHRFPVALPRVVGDVESWHRRVLRLLDLLKAAIHEAAPLPANLMHEDGAFPHDSGKRSAALSRRRPSLCPLVDAVSWSTYLVPQEAELALDWIDANAEELAALLSCEQTDGLMTAMLLWSLVRQEGPDRIDPLLPILSDQRLYVLPTAGIAAYRDDWISKLKTLGKGQIPEDKPQPPECDLADSVREFAVWICEQRPKTRRRALDLFALLLPPSLVDVWVQGWAQIESALKPAARLLVLADCRDPVTKELRRKAKQEADELRKLDPAMPWVNTRSLFSDIREMSRKENRILCDPAIAALRMLPCVDKQRPVRAGFLRSWLQNSRTHLPTQVAQLIRHFEGYLKKFRGRAGWLEPWRDVIQSSRRRYPYTIDDEILTLSDGRLWPLVFDVVGAICSQYTESLPNNEDIVVSLVKSTRSVDRSAQYFAELCTSGRIDQWIPDDVIRCASQLATAGASFDKLTEILDKAHDASDSAIDGVRAVAELLQQHGWPGAATKLLIGGDAHLVVLLGQRVLTLKQFDKQIEPPARPDETQTPEWGQRFPTEFHPSLGLLESLDSAAQKTAEGLLSKDFRDPADVEREASAIRTKLNHDPDNQHLARRLRNLIERGERRDVSPKRIERLQAKLDYAVIRAVARTWRDELDAALRNEVNGALQLESTPEWLFEPAQLEVLTAILRLPKPSRTLGLELVRRRLGSRPWSLDELPANQAFVAQLRERGINPEPWVNPTRPQRVTGKNGRSVWVGFEDDPLEVFRMGEHFNTCLSLGSFNFFSAVSNAADVNKQVVFARDDRGRVVGRCLLALTNDGCLLTFHAYCHDAGLGFADMLAQLAEELAVKMQVHIVSRGDVPCLVASKWYDDGPRDLCGRFAFLERGSSFRESLNDIELESLVQAVEQACAPLPLNELTLPRVLELDEFDRRPELVRPLLSLVADCGRLPDETWVRAAELAQRAQEHEFAQRVLRDRGIPYLSRYHKNYGVLPDHIMPFFCKQMPSATLRVLRATRLRRIRSDEEETQRNRRRWLALAHETLGRAQLAQKLRVNSEA